MLPAGSAASVVADARQRLVAVALVLELNQHVDFRAVP
jgi:hypothetical protein